MFEAPQLINDRQWKLFYNNEKVITNETDVQIIIKTRNDEPCIGVVPDQIFSSLKYEIHFKVTPGTVETLLPIYLGKIQLCDPETFEEVFHEDSSSINGNTEGSLTQGHDGSYNWKTKLQFKDLQSTRDYALQFCLYQPQDLMRPILVMRSPELKVFARRTSPVQKKRCRQEQIVSNKKCKQDSLSEYLKNLESLISYTENLPHNEQKVALMMALEQLVGKEAPMRQEDGLYGDFGSKYFNFKNCDDLIALLE